VFPVSTYLVNFAFKQKQLNKRRSVLDGLLNDRDGLVVLLLVVVNLAQEVVEPKQGRWRFGLSFLVVGRVLGEVVVKTGADGLDDLELGGIGVERSQVDEQRRDTLAQGVANVFLCDFPEFFTCVEKINCSSFDDYSKEEISFGAPT